VICLVFAGLALVLSAIGIYGVLAASLAPSLRITRIRPASALRYE
jgi:ABC-type lipoprotein release transport system permease subunit